MLNWIVKVAAHELFGVIIRTLELDNSAGQYHETLCWDGTIWFIGTRIVTAIPRTSSKW